MRQIIRRRDVVPDDVHYPDEPPSGGTRAVIPLAQFLSARAAGQPVDDAILITPTDDVQLLAGHLPRLTLIVIDFPTLGEGRGYSQARLLRTRLHYNGELRARGALKRDQLLFLARCGFDSFQLDANENLHDALAGFATYSVAYQDGSQQLLQLRRR